MGASTTRPPFDRPFDWTASGDPQSSRRTFGFLVTDAGLQEVATYADGIGPWKRYIVSSVAADRDHDGTVGDENGDATSTGRPGVAPPADQPHPACPRRGLLVHTWTFRNEPSGSSPTTAAIRERYLQFLWLGVDGVFADFATHSPSSRAPCSSLSRRSRLRALSRRPRPLRLAVATELLTDGRVAMAVDPQPAITTRQ
jgi:glycerophosphoryl diester phosphodiesterase